MKTACGVLLVLEIVAACGGETAVPPRDGSARMRGVLAELADRAAATNPFFGATQVRRCRTELQQLGDRAPWRLRLDAGIAELRLGNEREGIAILTAARQALQDGRIEGDAAAAVAVSFHLGVAWMRRAETENCCAGPTPESCILPLQGTGLHTRKEGATNAAFFFAEVLRNTPPDDYWHHAARWLSSIAHMALGTYPDGVPAQDRLPERAFGSEQDFPRLRDVARLVGLDTWGHAGAAVIDDFDGDERLDVIVSDWHPEGALRYFRNRGDGTFEERSEAAGFAGITGGLNAVQADYDGDGDLDLLVLRGAWCFESGCVPNSLLSNDGKGTFTDVTYAAGIAEPFLPTQTAAFADYDLDGDLDLYVGNENCDRVRAPCQLFCNDGAGRFTDVARAAGVTNDHYAKGVVWGDVDGDRHPDLHVSNRDGANRLYRNRRDGTFEDVAERAGVTKPLASFPTWFFDYDNDGALDLFVAEYDTGIGHIDAHLSGGALPFEPMRLYRGDGEGGFRDVGEQLGLTYPAMPMGCNFGDVDGDGWLDFYLGTGDPEYHSLMPNLLYRNQRGERFVDVTMASGTGHLQKGHGVAFADLDHDGDQDLFATMGGAYPGDAFHNVLFENPGFGNRWLALRLVGVRENRCAIGARIRVDFLENGVARSVFRHVTSGGSFGSNPLRQTIGLGKAEKIVAVEVSWPRSGAVQRFVEVPMDTLLRIVEGEAAPQRIDLAATPFRAR